MKSEFDNTNGISSIPKFQPDCLKSTEGNNYRVMVVDPDEDVHRLVKKALKYFSFGGKNICTLSTSSLKTAVGYWLGNSGLFLVILNRSAFDKVEIQQFMDFVNEDSTNKECQIVFKDELITSHHLFENSNLNGEKLEIEEVRENMINYLRQVYISYDNKVVGGRIKKQVALKEDGAAEIKEEGKIDKKSNLNREKIYSVLAHDLKGPISSIKTLMDVLTSEPELLDKNTTQDLLLNVRDTTSSIQEMLENFMFWVRVHKQHVHFSPKKICLNDIVNQNISLLKSTAFNKKIKLQSGIASNISIFADEYMLNTVLRNLMFNALKFTKTCGEVVVLVCEHANDVEIIIRDNGVGISEDEIANIINDEVHFSKLGTDKEKGTGFGLLISKEFIEKNGGQLSIKSNKDFGSSFSFTVPKWTSMIAN